MPPRSPTPSRRRRIDPIWLAMAIAITLLLAVLVFAPGLPWRLVGVPTAPPAPPTAEPPAAPAPTGAGAAEREAAWARLEQVRRPQRTDALDEPIERRQAPTQPDEAAARALLAEARGHYRALRWTAARGAAERVRILRASTETKAAAATLAGNVATIEELFRRLDERDELQRGYETDPALVMLTLGGRETLAVPARVVDGRSEPVTTGDPVAVLESQRRTGQLTVLVQGRTAFTPTTLPQQRVERIARADVERLRGERREEFLAGWRRLQAGENAGDATAWYAAARFAYRHRLDEYVAEALDRALALDRDLVSRVREDKAALLYAAMVAHLKDGNQRQADAFMAIIARRYLDTEQGRQAKLFHEGRTGELVAAVRAAAKTPAPAAGDAGVPVAAAAPADESAGEPAAPAVAVGGDEATADRLAAEASAKAREAMDLGNVPQRDTLYREGRALAERAMAIYDRLLRTVKDPKRQEELEAKGIAANKVRFMCIKYARPFH